MAKKNAAIRNRKKSNSKAKEAAPKTNERENPPSPATETIVVDIDDPQSESLSHTFYQHPLVKVAPFIILPYIIYNSIYLLTLRHPEVVNTASLGLIHLRPAIQAEDPRQVLILGAEFPENRFVSGGLASPLKLEIVNEAFDAQNYYCRDGSVSWFQFMRFAEPVTAKSANRETTFDAWKELCSDRNHSIIELFHPKEYSASACSTNEKWSKCWAKECFSVLNKQWACEYDEQRECPYKFERILHQVRHPEHTVQTLNTTICPFPNLRSSFLRVVAGFFPTRNWGDLSCADAMGWYTIDFHKALIKAREAGYVQGAFQIERASPCEVAQVAGFTNVQSAVYQPNIENLDSICRDDDATADAISPDTFTRVKQENGKVLEISKLDTSKFEDQQIARELNELVTLLGYDKDGSSEFL